MATFSRAAVLAALATVMVFGVASPLLATASRISPRDVGVSAGAADPTGTVSMSAAACAASAAHLAAYVDALTGINCGVAGAKADRLATASAGVATAAAGVAALAAEGTPTCELDATAFAAVAEALEIADRHNPCGLDAAPRGAKVVATPSPAPHPIGDVATAWVEINAHGPPTPPPLSCCSGTTMYGAVCCVDVCAELVMMFPSWFSMDMCCGNVHNHEPPSSICLI